MKYEFSINMQKSSGEKDSITFAQKMNAFN